MIGLWFVLWLSFPSFDWTRLPPPVFIGPPDVCLSGTC